MIELMKRLGNQGQDILDASKQIDFLGPLALRLYLVPIFWMAGTNKLNSMDSTIAWFANPDWGLGLPFPVILAWLATLSEVVGALFLLIGFAVRWIAVPLMVTMVVAAVTVHLDHGWYAIAPSSADLLSSDAAVQAARDLKGFLGWLKDAYPGRYETITEHGQPVILNNGIEFAATYFIMLLTLFFVGAGRYLSADYWIHKMAREK